MSIASFILLSAGLITIVPGTWAAPYAKDGNNVSTAVIGQKYYFTKGNDNLYTICGKFKLQVHVKTESTPLWPNACSLSDLSQ